MIVGAVSAVIVELIFAGRVGDLVGRHPMLEVEALCCLMRIGATLVAEGTGIFFDKRAVHLVMAFSEVVKMLNMRVRAKSMKRATLSPVS